MAVSLGEMGLQRQNGECPEVACDSCSIHPAPHLPPLPFLSRGQGHRVFWKILFGKRRGEFPLFFLSLDLESPLPHN